MACKKLLSNGERNDFALACAIMLLALAGFSIAGAMLAQQQDEPSWLATWCQMPLWFRFIVGVIAGLAASIGVAEPIVPWFNRWLKARLPRYYEERDDERVPPSLTGRIERFAFTFFVVAYPGGATAGMFVWLGLKMAANWNKDAITTVSEEVYRQAARFEKLVWNRHAFVGLLTGFVSMCFAWVGGMLARFVMGLPVNP